MKTRIKLWIAFILACGAFLAAGCDNNGAEEAADEAREEIEEAGDAVEQATD